eukprot:6203993-Pleurochrysis_carterae.AAC.5
MTTRSTTQAATVRERVEARRLMAATWVAPGRGRGQAASAMRATVIQNLKIGARKERTASTHAARVQNGKPCVQAKGRSALRRFHIL